MTENSNIILFVGQSGLKVTQCLERLQSQVKNDVEIYSIEKQMTELSGRPFSREILLEKLSYQYTLWQEAFKIIESKINMALNYSQSMALMV